MHRWLFWVAIALVLTVILAIAAFRVVVERLPIPVTQPLSVTPSPPGSSVDLGSWDGHPAAVLRLRIYDLEREEVVWDLQTEGGPAMLERVSLQPGPNPALTVELRDGHFAVTVPESGESFTLTPGSEYEVRVWSVVGDGPRSRHVERAARFVLGETR